VIKRCSLAQYLNEYLNCAAYKDYAPNGIQVEGKDDIQRICTAVTASDEVISQAVHLKADALMVHHGYFWRGEDPQIVGMKKKRISNLLKHDITLFAYHLPLDCHMELGNNASLSRLFELDAIQMHDIDGVENLLWSGVFSQKKSGDELTEFLAKKLGRKPLHISGSNRPVKSVALCSGGAQDYIENAHKLGVDAYISGEISERTYYQARELGIHYYSCGHHATERLGIQSLGDFLAKQFNLDHFFIDSNNPV